MLACTKTLSTISILAALCTAASQQRAFTASDDTPEANQDFVPRLPGYDGGDLHFNMYAGNITVDEKAGRSLFYTLAEASRERSDADPLVLWLNGGPGCTSIGGGFFSELGPFYPTPDGSLVKNPYSWNMAANFLFLESPAFVGWSTSDTPEDAKVGDWRTAEDAYVFLTRWLERFPRYRNRPLYLAGESYAGHYVPNLALRILEKSEESKAHHHMCKDINLKGFMVGNPLTNVEEDSYGALRFWYSHGMISAAAYKGVRDYCDFAAIYPLLFWARNAGTAAQLERNPALGMTAGGAPEVAATNAEHRRTLHATTASHQQNGASSLHVAWMDETNDGSNGDLLAALKPTTRQHNDGDGDGADDKKCQEFVEQAMQEGFDGINIYDIYADVCLRDQERPERSAPPGTKASPGMPTSTDRLLRQSPPRYDPCIDDEVERYMNRRDVQDAFHANMTGELPGPWVTCNPALEYNRSDVLASMIPVYEKILYKYEKHKLRVLVYSGDVDAILPVIGTRHWIRSLNLKVTEHWRNWRSTTGQVAGWRVGYERGLTFASVRGAGHMVPYTQPERAQTLFVRWIHGEEL